MSGFGFGGRRGVRVIGTVAAAICCSAAAASAASAATLSVTVTPAQIHTGKQFKIDISGSFSSTEVRGKGYLLAFDQFNDTSPCKSQASQEAKKQSVQAPDPRTHKLKPVPFAHLSVTSPIGWRFSFTAGSAGPRRVCAYLFAKKNPAGTGSALKRATATFRVKR
jgi:hypothetical protein